MKKEALTLSALLCVNTALASMTIPMYSTDNNGYPKNIGFVQVDDMHYGLLLTPNLHDLPPGIHGFHVHEMPSCEEHAMAAGGHLDPKHTNKHLGPYSNGHLGDLPVLIVNNQGSATLPVLAPRLKMQMIKGHALMIHAGGDNYSDLPEKLGGGGARIACGAI